MPWVSVVSVFFCAYCTRNRVQRPVARPAFMGGIVMCCCLSEFRFIVKPKGETAGKRYAHPPFWGHIILQRGHLLMAPESSTTLKGILSPEETPSHPTLWDRTCCPLDKAPKNTSNLPPLPFTGKSCVSQASRTLCTAHCNASSAMGLVDDPMDDHQVGNPEQCPTHIGAQLELTAAHRGRSPHPHGGEQQFCAGIRPCAPSPTIFTRCRATIPRGRTWWGPQDF